ncbi:MAG: carbohydrate ABC transporter permease [Acetatifactor sp.]|nr:carbohydrate ABC transporter permease [Acetatifactor sp.]
MKVIKKTVYYVTTVFLTLVFVTPLWMVFINSVKEKKDARFFALGLPSVWRWDNYETVIKAGSVLRAFFNGLIVSGGSVLIVLAFSSIAAFVISRSTSKWAKGAYYTFLCGLVIPVAFVPTYLILDTLKLFNTYMGLILVSATYGLPMSIFLYTGFVKTIPRELDEAAFLDGCPPLKMVFEIIFPLLKPITITLFIFNFVGCWNDIQVPLYFSNTAKWNLPLTVYNFYGTYGSSWNLVFADIVMTVLPLLVLYLVCQKYIIAGMTAGAVKG